MKQVHIDKMKHVGIIRRLGDLGRVSLPMEFRRSMMLHKGDLVEIHLCEDSDNGLCLIIKLVEEEF